MVIMGMFSGIGRGLVSVGTDMERNRIDREDRQLFLDDRENERSYQKEVMRDTEARRAVELTASVAAEGRRYDRRVDAAQVTWENQQAAAQQTWENRQELIPPPSDWDVSSDGRTRTNARTGVTEGMELRGPGGAPFGLMTNAAKDRMYPPPTDDGLPARWLTEAYQDQDTRYDSAGRVMGNRGDVDTALDRARGAEFGGGPERRVPEPGTYDYMGVSDRMGWNAPPGSPSPGGTPRARPQPPTSGFSLSEEEYERASRSGRYNSEQLSSIRARAGLRPLSGR